MSCMSWSLASFVMLLAACSSNGGDTIPPDDTGSSEDSAFVDSNGTDTFGGGDGLPGTDTGPGECSSDGDCATKMGVTTPSGCGVATCDPLSHKCAYKAKDADGDGHSAHVCSSASVTVETGDDCDDTDKSVYPSQTAACCDGATWKAQPKATGACHCGTKLCQADGTFAACAGVKNPAARDCSSPIDNDCDGVVDDTQCGCTKDATKKCSDVASGATGKCGTPTVTCKCDAAGCKYDLSPCSASDTCGSLGAKGTCASSTTTCAGGKWGTCPTSIGADTCDKGNDDSCNGLPNEGCSCINGTSVSCGVSGTNCTLGTMICAAGKPGGCTGNNCTKFYYSAAPAPGVSLSCGPACFSGTTCKLDSTVCASGYHISSGGCNYDCGAHGSCGNDPAFGTPTTRDVHWYSTVSGCDGTVAVLQGCWCIRDGFS